MNKRGFFFSLDAIVAIGIALVMTLMFFSYLADVDPSELRENELLEYSKSVLTVMELEDSFAQAEISPFLGNYTRNETCFNVTVYDAALLAQYSVVKENCVNTSYPVTLGRSVVVADLVQYVKMEGWYE